MLTGGNGHMIEWGDVANKSTGWIEFEARRPSSSMDEDDDILRFDSLIWRECKQIEWKRVVQEPSDLAQFERGTTCLRPVMCQKPTPWAVSQFLIIKKNIVQKIKISIRYHLDFDIICIVERKVCEVKLIQHNLLPGWIRY